MFPDTPTTKDHFKVCFTAFVVYTGRVKIAFGLTGLPNAQFPPVKEVYRRLPICSGKPRAWKIGVDGTPGSLTSGHG